MKREEISELHYITHCDNVPSILKVGILSHMRAGGYSHVSVANPSVQNRRSGTRLPNGRPLHHYANLYFNARNPMMYVLSRDQGHENLAVIAVASTILELPGVIISDGNAASFGTLFTFPDEAGLGKLDETRVLAQYWTDSDSYAQTEKKRQRCAEVLVPNYIPPHYLTSIHCSCQKSESTLRAMKCRIPLHRSEHLFFL